MLGMFPPSPLVRLWKGLVLRREMYSPWPVSAAEGQHTTGGNGNIYLLLLHTLPGAREREDKAAASVIYRLHQRLLTILAPSPIMQPLLLFRASMFSFCRGTQVEKLLPAPADRHFDSDGEIKVAAQMKRQMSWLLQTGRRMRQMVSLCRARAQSLGLSSCSVISIKEKASVSSDQKSKSVWQGPHSMAKTGAGVTRAPIIFNQAPLSSWHWHFASERKILVFYEKMEEKGKSSYYMSLSGIKIEFEWATIVDAHLVGENGRYCREKANSTRRSGRKYLEQRSSSEKCILQTTSEMHQQIQCRDVSSSKWNLSK